MVFSIPDTSFLPHAPSPHTIFSNSLSDISTHSPYSPPAYHSQAAQIPSITVDSFHAPSSKQSSSAPYSFRRSSFSFAPPPSDDGHLPHVPPYDGAHVAIDDKCLLARLADLASAPLDGDVSDAADPTDAQVSAPEWREEELDDFVEPSHRTPPIPLPGHSTALAFPPPPFEGNLSAPALYHHSYSFENLAAEFEPSGPSFEEGCPSAPPLEETDMSPSAPSAPPLADNAECEGMDGDGSRIHPCSSQDDDLSMPFQSAHGPVASNGIPPCYCL